MDRELICTHEAGHAVAHYSYGHPIHFILVGPDRGGVRLEPLIGPDAWGRQTIERTEQEIVATLAGQVATEILLGRNSPDGEESDTLFIRSICEQRGWDEGGIRDVLRLRTCALIRDWEPAIRALATELLAVGEGRLCWQRIMGVIEAASGRDAIPRDWGRTFAQGGS